MFVQAYVHHIRRAQHFVYIENQYFLGSCFEWADSKDVGCSHTVCAELTQKICAKIRARERFTAYVVQPMFPEGDPYSGARAPAPCARHAGLNAALGARARRSARAQAGPCCRALAQGK